MIPVQVLMAERNPSQPSRHTSLDGRQGFLLAFETWAGREYIYQCTHVTCQLEGNPSSQQGTWTSSTVKETLPAGKVHATGRKPFQQARYMYLDGWKENIPAGKVVPC
ncbi:uncharacterized protein PGTG_09078 [Puccinia graminis f. sp. tritici CRL 75-36-700-3]|uniref:Uncharacterized protein n=1 Tax=Puccinia graminis f. sp. tritici (strain CRL 75-36-700-3 / race SCCL) TaxID=418459 RepID=E3KFR1_PUCGT|nr:uncharacterized protein PGTG_09078 [Puccinia graminis f. sp. tritici CRL 75-36-700-3]EFP83125.1 hypothetical protein PGTG_09078 [Puccinia graminis f. sp. tritici CRL 75-36-700-3]